MKKTDWTEYYQNKKSWFSSVTQGITLNQIKKYYLQYSGTNSSILELGGGNSCFLDGLCNSSCSPSSYSVIDNNQLSLDLLSKRRPECEGLCLDLLGSITAHQQYDFVFSIGLIEHFQGNDISKIIESHFKFCAPNGIVLISFPTPTLQYRFIRKCMELLHVWQFWDECPLTFSNVSEYFSNHGEVLNHKLLRLLPLTQTMCVIKKYKNEV